MLESEEQVIEFEPLENEEEIEVLVQGVDDIPAKEEVETPPVVETPTKGPSQSALLLEGLQKLVEKKAEPAVPIPEPVKVPELNTEELNAGFLDDPAKSVTTLLRHFVKTELAPGLQQVLPDSVAIAKAIGNQDPDVVEMMKDYPEEMESTVASFDSVTKAKDPYMYRKAANMVKLNHVQELIDKGIAKSSEAAKKEVTGTPMHYEGGQRPAVKKRQVILTPEQVKLAGKWGISKEDFAKYYGK